MGTKAEGGSDEITLLTGTTELRLITPDAFAKRFGKAPLPCPSLPCLAVMTVKSADLSATERYLDLAGVSFTRTSRTHLLVPADQATGLLVEFVAA